MFHKSNLGMFGEGIRSDINGFVPEINDGPWDFAMDWSDERTHDDNGELTELGEWWEDEGYAEWRDDAIKQTARAEAELKEYFILLIYPRQPIHTYK